MPQHDGPWSGLPSRPPAAPEPRQRDPRIRLAIVAGVAAAVALIVWGLNQAFPGQLAKGDEPYIGYQIGFIAIMALSLFSRPIRFSQAARYVLIWGVLGAGLGLGYAYRGELETAALRVRSELIPAYATPSGPHELVLSQDQDGGYSVMGAIDGKPIRLAIDTGASDIVLSPQDAARLGVDVGRLNFALHFETANGVGDGAAYTAEALGVGPIRLSNVEMSINRAPMGVSLLGMAFLRRLESFEVKDGRLYLRWRG